MVLRVAYYTVLCGCVKALIPETLLVHFSDNYICMIQTLTMRLHTVLTVEMVWEGNGDLKPWDLYMSFCSVYLGSLVFKTNKLHLKRKTTLFIFEYLWCRAALVGFLSQKISPPISRVGLCSPLCVFHKFYHVPNTAWQFPLGFLELFLLERQKDLSFQPTFKP